MRGNSFKGDILWHFDLHKVVWFVLAAMLEGILLPSNMAANTTFCSYLVKRLIVTLRCAVNITTSLKFQCKICVQKEVILNFKNHILVTSPSFKKMVRVWKTKSLLFCLRYDPLIVFRRQNFITFIVIKTMSHDLLVQMAYWYNTDSGLRRYFWPASIEKGIKYIAKISWG